MKENKKLATVVTLCVLGMCFFQWGGTASAAELVVNGGPNNITPEQKAEWVDEIDGGGHSIAHDTSLSNNKLELIGGDYSKYKIFGAFAQNGDALNNSVKLQGVTGNISSVYGSYVASPNENGYANGNTVTIDGFSGGIDKIRGGEANEGASNNTVNLINIGNTAVEIPSLDMTVFGSIIGGDSIGTVVNNKVVVSGVNGFYAREIYGGKAWGKVYDDSVKSEVIGNSVSISGSGTIISTGIYGGYSEKGNAENNQVSISGQVHLNGINVDNTNEPLFIYGGYTTEGDANNNIVDISGDAKIESDAIYGGYTENGDTNGNKVTFDGVTFTAAEEHGVYGGYSYQGNSCDNYVEIENSNIDAGNSSIVGGGLYAGNGEIVNNKVFIDRSSIYTWSIIGGEGWGDYEGSITSNYVGINNSSISAFVYGGRGSGSSEVNGNVVEVTKSNNRFVGENNDTCYRYVDFVGGYSNSGTVSNNLVNISESEFLSGDDVQTAIWGGKSENGKVVGNSAVVSASTISGRIYGGVSVGSTPDDGGIAENNSVYVSGSKISILSNDRLLIGIAGGVSNKEASGNTVIIINKSKVTASSGGKHPDIAGGFVNGVGKADDNYVAVVDSTVAGNIYGGLSMVIPDSVVDDEESAAATEGSANNNTIRIENSRVEGMIVAGRVVAADDVTSEANNNTIIISGENTNIEFASLVGSMDAKKGTGNTLVLDGWSGSASSVAGFDNYSFQNIKNIDGAVLTVNSASDIDADTKFNVSFAGSVDLQEGQSVKLISVNDSVNVKNENINTSVGTSLDVAGTLVGGDKSVDFKVGKITLNRQTDLVGSANAAAAAFLADGGELAVDGLAQINSDEYGFNTFAAAYGANSDYDNGTDLKGWNNIVGVGHNAKTEAGDFAWGVFYEGGTGESDAANSYHVNVFNADGKTVYNGYGTAARLSKDNGVYYEAGVRAGKLKNNLSNALMDTNDIAYSYKTESDYFGYHVGVGKAVALNGGDKLDVYARYYHTKVDGDSFVVGSGDRYSLDKVYSDRIRVGGRYTDNLNEAVKVYYGAAYEYEFSGEAEGSVNGYALNESDLGGSSFVGELGLLMNNPGSAWTVDMALQAYGGQREGVGGKVQATYHF